MVGRKRNSESSFNLGVSESSWNDLAAQVRDVRKFLQKHKRELRRLKRFPGLESIALDFPLEDPMSKSVMVYTLGIPEALIQLAAAAGVSIDISIYIAPGRTRAR
jgi:hypothetical protein